MTELGKTLIRILKAPVFISFVFTPTCEKLGAGVDKNGEHIGLNGLFEVPATTDERVVRPGECVTEVFAVMVVLVVHEVVDDPI